MTKKPSKLSQSEKFKAMAKEMETDGSETLFDHLMKKIAKAPQPDKKKPVSKG